MFRHINSRVISLLDCLGSVTSRFKRPFFILLTIYIVFYFGELANFSLSIDDERAAVRTDAATWAAQGRWLQYLVESFLVSQPTLPFFPGFLFGCLICAAYLLLIRAHRYDASDPSAIVVFGLFSAFPTLFFILDFAVITVGLGVGILLACACIYSLSTVLRSYLDGRLSRRECVGSCALQVGLAATAVGAYQSLILLIAAGACGLFILERQRGRGVSVKEFIMVHGYLACALMAGVAASLLIARGFQWLLEVRPRYIEHYWNPDLLIANPSEVIGAAFARYTRVYGGSELVYGFSRQVTFPLIVVLGAIALALDRPTDGPLRKLLVVCYVTGMTAIPFAINLMHEGRLPYRALSGVPYVFWFCGAAAVFCKSRIVRSLAMVLVVLVSLQFLYTFSLFQATKRLVLEHDKQVASAIYQRIVDEVPDFSRSKTYHVAFWGALEFQTVYPEISTSTLSASFFEWDGGSAGRITTFMRILGHANIEMLDDAQRKAYLPTMQSMPLWPRQGSVKAIGDAVLVRLGE